jgi:hypothetical protein
MPSFGGSSCAPPLSHIRARQVIPLAHSAAGPVSYYLFSIRCLRGDALLRIRWFQEDDLKRKSVVLYLFITLSAVLRFVTRNNKFVDEHPFMATR